MVSLSPKMMANWFMAGPQFLMGIVHFFAALCKPSQRSLKATSSEGREKNIFMKIDYITAGDAPVAFGPYSQATRVGELIFCSGQAAIDPATGKLVEGGIKEQTRQVFRNLDAVLRAAGSDVSRVVKTSVFIHDWKYFTEVNDVFGEIFGDRGPARSTIRGERWPEGSLIAIEAIAAAGEE